MKINHVALWTDKLERMKDFYIRFFGGTCGNKYENLQKQFQSYFIAFDSGAKIELMSTPTVQGKCGTGGKPLCGYAHLALSVGSRERVNEVTELIRLSGYTVTGEPRMTGDGCYESCVVDPDGNLIEITI
ncbi:lactoylglutathione lyase [Anaerobacterium chartisolvens]|uniref:Lactoylglutathione lyase n=1 Tax=Anaerobacterium chartisolvens TaxID=1297424 RepID=A0A369AJ09_9FIRM|nr:VOC family protein [Anaerobacterium chartisolvens]RCX09075.1 lactoylglutathione lyase [Anaerobacterium chartisolvens]